MKQPLKVVVIGARRSRQGIGEFVARFFLKAGCEVCAVVGTTAETAEQARVALAGAGAESCRPYSGLGRALSAERPDVVAACSPYTAHRQALELCASHGVHCLCEKPLHWGDGSPVEEATRLVDAFASRRLHLALVTQWPCTLEDFYRLYPGEQGRRTGSFDMVLSPVSTGEDMVPDSAPHPLSMLQHLVGCGDIVGARAEYFGADRRKLCLYFDYNHATGAVATRLQFSTCEHPPRPAAFGVNGRSVRRRIELPGYRLFLESQERSIEIEDPLERLVARFVREVESGAPIDRQGLVESVQGLEVLAGCVRIATVRKAADAACLDALAAGS